MLVFLLCLSMIMGRVCAQVPGDISRQQRLTVQVVGMESAEGTLQVAIFDSAQTFLEQPCRPGVIRSLSADTVQMEFTLPTGQYAVAVYQDVNQNQQLDKNFLGIPREAYGFSGNVRGSSLGPPSFQEAMISLDQQPRTICIELR